MVDLRFTAKPGGIRPQQSTTDELTDSIIKLRKDWLRKGDHFNVNSVAGEAPVGWHYEQIQPGQPFFEYPWYSRLFEDPEFTLRHWDRYFELRQRKWNTASMFAEVEALAALLSAEAARREFDRWPRLGTCVWPNPDGSEAATTYESAVGWMKDWLRQRFIWMDSQFNPPPVYSEQGGIETFGGIVPLGFVMAMSHSNLPGGVLNNAPRAEVTSDKHRGLTRAS